MKISFQVNEKPMSMNMVYPTGNNGRRFLTAEGKAYKEIIEWEALQAMGSKKIFEGNLRVTIDYTFPNKRTDMNNCHKLILDAMQGIVYANDRQIHEEHYFRSFDKQFPKFIIEIEKIDHKNKLKDFNS